MKENRAILLLKSLNKDEIRWFQKFVQSPYHNANPKLVTLYELLRKLYPEFPAKKTTPEILFKQLFTRKSFDAPTMRLLLHRLANLIEDFLVYEQTKNDKVIREKQLVRNLSSRNAYDLFEKKTRKLLKYLDEMPAPDVNYYRHKGDLHLQYYGHPATNRQIRGATDLRIAMKYLDDYFSLSKVKLATALKAREHTLAVSSEIRFLDEVLKEVNSEDILIRLYSQIFNLQENPNSEAHFDLLRQTFLENVGTVNLEDRRTAIQVLLNFCVRKINAGLGEYSRKIFELYKIGLVNDCLIYNGKITATTFINIVTPGLNLKEFDWVNSFIDQYSKYLDRVVKEETVVFSRALILNSQKDNFGVIDLLMGAKFSKPLFQLSSKSILAKSYVEVFLTDESYYDLSVAQLNAFEKYCRKNIAATSKVLQGYINFIQATKRFIRLVNNRKDLSTFELKISNTENLISKKWLLDLIQRKK